MYGASSSCQGSGLYNVGFVRTEHYVNHPVHVPRVPFERGPAHLPLVKSSKRLHPHHHRVSLCQTQPISRLDLIRAE